MLISVCGVGPKVALAALSGGTPRELLRAIAAGDAKRFQAVPGIGKRTAERVIVELREKVAGELGGARRGDRGLEPRRRPRSLPARACSTSATRRAEAERLLDAADGETRRGADRRRAARRRGDRAAA